MKSGRDATLLTIGGRISIIPKDCSLIERSFILFIWKSLKRANKRIDDFIEWLAELTFTNPKVGLPLSLGIIAVLLLVAMLVASMLNIAIDIRLGEKIGGTFSGIGAAFGKWQTAILGLGLILFVFSRIMRRVNANIESKNEEDEKTNDTSS